MADEIYNHVFRRDGSARGVLESVDQYSDDDSDPGHPVLVVRTSSGERKAVHFRKPNEITRLAEQRPQVGDTLSVTPGGYLSVARPDVYGGGSAPATPSADWDGWAGEAARRRPGGSDYIVAPKPTAEGSGVPLLPVRWVDDGVTDPL
ncbi:MAG: hypothetical protein ACREN1_08345 [Candidatus Dormibacteria bacterium]